MGLDNYTILRKYVQHQNKACTDDLQLKRINYTA